MRQISYLTMAFLPASFAAVSPFPPSWIDFHYLQTFFGMNVEELTPNTKGTLIKYFAIALPLTALTAWIVTSFQYKGVLPEGSAAHKRLAWPVYLILKKIKERKAAMSRREVEVNEGNIAPISVIGYLEDDEDYRKDQLGQRHAMNGLWARVCSADFFFSVLMVMICFHDLTVIYCLYFVFARCIHEYCVW